MKLAKWRNPTTASRKQFFKLTHYPNFAPGLTVSEGEVIATQIGLPGVNIFFDWGVYDLRQKNESSMDPDWLGAHPGEQAPYAICWLEFLTPEDQVIVNALPTGIEGSASDYCN